MALGDPISFQALSDGIRAKIIIDGFVDGGTYDFGGTWSGTGFGKNDDNDPASAKIVITVTREGYSGGTLGTVQQTIYGVPHQLGVGYNGTGVMRKAWVGAGDPVRDETESAGDLECVIVLSDPIYNDDVINSVAIAANWYTDNGGGGSTNGSNSATLTGGSLTNSSTKDYGKPVVQWLSVGGAFHRDRVKADFQLQVIAAAKHGVAAVKFTVTDGTTTDTELVTTTTAIETESGLYAEAWQSPAFVLSQFIQGATLSCDFQVYPKVGDADAVTGSSGNTVQGAQGHMDMAAKLICDKDDLLDVIRWVATTGNDANPGTEISPFLTVQQALESTDRANIIYVKAGTYTWLVDPGTRWPNTEWSIVRPAPGLTAADVIFNIGAAASTDVAFLQVKECTIRANATNWGWNGGPEEDALRFTECICDINGQTSTVVGTGVPLFLVENCTGDVFKWSMTASGKYALVGCAGASGIGLKQLNQLVACEIDDLRCTIDSTPTTDCDNVFWQNNRIHSCNGSAFIMTAISPVKGLALVGNEFEGLHTASQLLTICDDIADANVLQIHNTGWGQRCSNHYNSTGSVAINSVNSAIQFCTFQVNGSKHDDFPTQNGNRTGSWEAMLSSGHHGNLIADETTSFAPQFLGLKTLLDVTPDMVDDAGYYTNPVTPPGDGDYRDKNAATNQLVWTGDKPVRYDLTGRLRPTAGNVVYRGARLPVPDRPTGLIQAPT